MEDRYLFKAKRIDNGEWICGDLIKTLGSNRSWISSEEADEARLRLISWHCAEWRAYEVDTDTICQCTGLKDKNGKLIWENDVLSGYLDDDFPEDETREYVLWNENRWCTKEKNSVDYEELDNFVSENYEIIGNIFDNSDLLRQN